ncbi:MAG: single-stranded DNA-binding protein [Spirochaetaceae bacterium]|nr:MAG: single-stranded DNA-binding protein [Spirochaetaceae bacterium]
MPPTFDASAEPAVAIRAATTALVAAVSRLRFAPPVSVVYNPLDYASAVWERYVARFASTKCRVVFLGMNPGPWGMAQTGVPFGEIDAVRDWMRLDAPVGRPKTEHPKRPIEGFACTRSEVSGRRLWALMRDRFGDAEGFFREHFVANYCPLVFMAESGRNITPDKLPAAERQPLYAACDDSLRATVDALAPDTVVGVGRFACDRATAALAGTSAGTMPRVVSVLHPSPASPAANRGWAAAATRMLVDAGVWSK